MVVEKLPPHDIEAEEAVIAALMADGEAVFKVAPILRPEDFFRDRNAWVYEACLALWERNEPIDQITVAHELARRDRLEAVGGLAFLSRLVAELPTAVGVEYHAQIVQRDAVYRRLIQAAGQITQMAYEGPPDLDGVLAKAEHLLMAIRGGEAIRDFVHIRTLLEQYLQGADAEVQASTLVENVRTGFMDLDALLGGLKRSDLVILAARPSMGKTSLALSIARNAAVGQRAKVAVFSLEMAGEQLAQRLLASEAEVDSTRLRLGEHTDAEERRIMHALGVLSEADIYIDDSPVLRVAELRSKARRLAAERGLDLVVVDYLQLMHGGYGTSGDVNRVQEISFISRSLKEIARELNVVVLALSQLSRAVEQRSPKIPMLSDLRESGSIEQDADVVIFIYREAAYTGEEEWERLHPTEPYPKERADIIVAKHRNGPTGQVQVRFRSKYAKFTDPVAMEP